MTKLSSCSRQWINLNHWSDMLLYEIGIFTVVIVAQNHVVINDQLLSLRLWLVNGCLTGLLRCVFFSSEFC